MRRPDRLSTLTTCAGALVLASQAAAHPGHGVDGGGAHWLHYVSDPLHVAPWVVGGLALVLLVQARRSVRRRAR